MMLMAGQPMAHRPLLQELFPICTPQLDATLAAASCVSGQKPYDFAKGNEPLSPFEAFSAT